MGDREHRGLPECRVFDLQPLGQPGMEAGRQLEEMGWYELQKRRSITGRHLFLHHHAQQSDLQRAVYRLDTDCEIKKE